MGGICSSNTEGLEDNPKKRPDRPQKRMDHLPTSEQEPRRERQNQYDTFISLILTKFYKSSTLYSFTDSISNFWFIDFNLHLTQTGIRKPFTRK